MYLISKLSEFVQIGGLASDLVAFAQRVWALQASLDQQSAEVGDGVPPLEPARVDAPLILSQLAVMTPEGRRLLGGLDLELHAGENAYIQGPNGTGKTALARTLMGLWPPARGSITVGRGGSIMCCPQDAILHDGSLASLLTDAEVDPAGPLPPEYLQQILHCVGLGPAVRELDLTLRARQDEWMARFSPGQRQRLAIARVLLRRPQYAILDEATASMDPATEHQLHCLLWEAGVTTITIGHQSECKLLQDPRIKYLITLDGQGGHYSVRTNDR